MEKIFCEICEKQTIYNIDQFWIHLKQTHGITFKEYYDLKFKKMNEGICKCCGLATKFYSFKKGYASYCSPRCASRDPDNKKKIKQTLKDRYGDENYVNIKGIKESWKSRTDDEEIDRITKINKTKLDRYNDTNFNNFDKIKQTKLQKYGNEFYTNIDQIKTSLINFYDNNRFDLINEKILETSFLELVSCDKRIYCLKCLKCGEIFEILHQTFYLRNKNNEVICTNCNPLVKHYSKGEKELFNFIKESLK